LACATADLQEEQTRTQTNVIVSSRFIKMTVRKANPMPYAQCRITKNYLFPLVPSTIEIFML